MNNPYGCASVKKIGKPWMPVTKARGTIHHVIILDRSQSMSVIRHAAVAGFNEEVDCINRLPINGSTFEHKVTLTIFSSDIDHCVFNMAPYDLKKLDWKSYIPYGRTALNDAIGSTVDRIRNDCYYDLLNPRSKIHVTIITDGKENNSRVYSTEQIRQKIAELQATNQWTFVYASTNADTEEIATSYAIPLSNTYKFDKSADGTAKAFNDISEARVRYSRNVESDPDAIVSEGFFKKA